MSFQRSSPLPPEFSVLASAVTKAEETIASRWPKKVWSEAELAQLEGERRFGSLSLVDALVSVGTLERRTALRSQGSGFLDGDDWDDEEDPPVEEVVYVVVGTLVKLIDDLKTTPGTAPYFISFHSGGGRVQATQLHSALQAAGITGFLSDELQTGAAWRDQTIGALSVAGTVFLFESEQYHGRPRCQVERDFATAAGKRVLRIGLCQRANLTGCPAWLDNDLQHVVYQPGGNFDLNGVLGQTLPNPVPLHVRRRAAHELASMLTPVAVGHLAGRLDCLGQLYGPDDGKKTQLVDISFNSIPSADRFCQEIDLLPFF